MYPTDAPQVSPSAAPSPDALALGRTSGKRTAEVLAGLRATLMPSPVTMALSTYSGRAVAGILLTVAGRNSRPHMNFIPARTAGFTALVQQSLAARPGPHTVVEIASGFSPRGVDLAQALPDLAVVEVDLPDVAADKQARLKRALGTLPPNITWRTADLGVVPLAQALDGLAADAVAAEGLMPYFPRATLVSIVAGVRAVLKPGGLFVADFSYREGVQLAGEAGRFFNRRVSGSPGTLADASDVAAVLTEGGLVRPQVYTMTALAGHVPSLPSPVANIELVAVAYAPDAPSPTGEAP